MIRMVLFGACGRMGQIVTEIMKCRDDIMIIAGVEKTSHPQIGDTVNDLQIISDEEIPPEADVWVDFSIGSAVLEHAQKAAEKALPLLISATGYDDDVSLELRRLSLRCPILVAPNLSIGIGVMDRLVFMATELLGSDFDQAVFELHHAGKRDAPSGTALRLAESIAGAGGKPSTVSLRAGGAIGEHRVHFVGSDEELIITHRASSRSAFARGVPRAVKFIADQDPGLYTIKDML